MLSKIEKFLASALGRVRCRGDESCADPASPVANTSQRERSLRRKVKQALYSHPEGNRPWFHISDRMKYFPATGPKRGGRRKSCGSPRLFLEGELDYMRRLDFVRDSEDEDEKDEKDEQEKQPTDSAQMQQTKKVLGITAEGELEKRKISVRSVATQINLWTNRTPDYYIWAERNPGGLATIDEEGTEEENPVLPSSVSTASEPDTDRKCSGILDKIQQEKKQKGVEEYGAEEPRRDSGFSNHEEMAPSKGDESANNDTENEDWHPLVIADEDIPEQVEGGLFRHARANPEDALWWVFRDRHFHQLESEREVIEQQVVQDAENASSSSSFAPATTPSDEARLSEFKAIRYEDLSAQAATKTRNDDKANGLSSSTTPHTKTFWFGFPLPPISRSAPLAKIGFSEPEVAASKDANKSNIHRRPSALDRIKYYLFPRPQSPLPPAPQHVASAAGALPTRSATDARPAGSGSGTTSAAPTPPPRALARYLATLGKEGKRLREERRTLSHRKNSLDKLEGRIPAPEYSSDDYQKWKFSSKCARMVKGKLW